MFGTYPIPDRQLANFLKTLQTYEPQVIGLDVFRDLPVEPGYLELKTALEDMENVIGIEKVLPISVPPPPALPPERIGIVDALLDRDGRQRRMLLGTQTEDGFRFSLALLTAEKYLAVAGIPLENGIKDKTTMRFGSAELPRLRQNFGGYVGVNAGGGDVQIMLDFRRHPQPFQVLSFQDIQNGNFNPEWLRGRIILVGVTAPSSQDYFSVATNSMISDRVNWIYGLEIHGHAVSQIISAALDGRSLLKTWSEAWEYIWLISWGVIGICLAKYNRSPLQVLIWLSVSLVIIIGFSYLSLLAGWWIPLIPPILILLLNSLGLTAFYEYDRLIQTKIAAQQQAVSILEKANVQLETRVAERTAQLQQSVTELHQAKEVAEMASRAKGTFLAQMSHELKTPLNAILGFSEIMAKDANLSNSNQERLGLITSSGEHLLSLINDILDLSKLEAGKYELKETDFNLTQLLEMIEGLFRLRIEQKGLKFLLEVSPEIPEYLVGDAPKIRQILINLIGNALKFTHQGSITLRVTCHENADTIGLKFEVEDTGEGIAAEELDKLFVAFLQTQSGKKAKTGTGLGLPISKQLAQLMEGDIKVSSQKGKGSIFRFTAKVKLPSSSSVRKSENSKIGLGATKENKVNKMSSEILNSTSSRDTPSSILSPETISQTLASMPPEWFKELHQATLRLNSRRVTKLLEQIPTEKSDVAKYLISLANNYEFDRLTELLALQRK